MLADADVALAELGHGDAGRAAGLGAYVALMLAGARPQQVRGAVLCDGPGLGRWRHRADVAELRDAGAAARTLRIRTRCSRLSRDLRPPDYATLFVRMAVESSGLDEPIAVAAVVRPPWLAAVVDEIGVTTCSVADALAMYAAANRVTPI